MKSSSQLKGGIYEVSFGNHSKMDGYATLISDIPTLSEITSPHKRVFKFKMQINKIN